jgi:cardiolipin synthase
MTALQTGDSGGDSVPWFSAATSVAGDDALQIVPSGPLIAADRIEPVLLNAIYSARRDVTLTTPYLVPGDALLTALTSAARRGVAVTLIVPRRVDSTLVKYASAGYNESLLAAGVRILLFEGGLLHTKSVLVDDELAIFGTVNLDLRSFELNFEVSTVVYGGAFAAQLGALQRRYAADSQPLNLAAWRARPRWRHFAENAAAVMSPLL